MEVIPGKYWKVNEQVVVICGKRVQFHQKICMLKVWEEKLEKGTTLGNRAFKQEVKSHAHALLLLLRHYHFWIHRRTVKRGWGEGLNTWITLMVWSPHLKPDSLECKVKWALGSITTNKAIGGDGIPVELFQILKDDAVKVLPLICQQIWKTQQWPQDWKMCFHSNPKER